MTGREWFPLAGKPERIIVGLMSGTSVDGIDAAAVAVTGQETAVKARLLAFSNTPFPERMRSRIFEAFRPEAPGPESWGSLHMELGELYAEAALDIIRKAGLQPEEVDAVGSHGQTVWHQPEETAGVKPFTVQLGDGNVIAQRTGIPCVSDFRTADMAAGGQGAPLVPFTEYLLYREEAHTVLLQNIGGIGNITVLPSGCGPEEVTAFDTGPGNMVIDALVDRITGGRQKMDYGGRMAAAGQVWPELLKKLLADPYFVRKPPKTTGRELFGEAYADWLLDRAQELKISHADLLATATALTAHSIADACRRFICPAYQPDRLLVGGGGSFNGTLMDMLAGAMAPLHIKVMTQEQAGGNSDAKEAVAFALLADCTLRGIPSSLPKVTGASRAALLGKVSYPHFSARKRTDGSLHENN